MPSEDRVEVARRLVARGWSYKRTGRALGVSPQTVGRWVNPGLAERSRAGSLAWKRAHRKRTKAYDRQYAIDVKTPCPWCDGEKEPDRVMCQRCRQAIADFRHSLAIGMYEEGWPVTEIAATLETTRNSMSVTLHRLHRRGLLGYRYRIGPDGYRLPEAA
jgi:predicted transcriptional regulator